MKKASVKQKILVVDDDPDMRIFFATLLKTGGFQPIVAKNGIEGFEKAKKENPVFIVIDVPMPDNGGMQMYRDLKLDQSLKQIPVLMISTIDHQTFIHYQKTKGIGLGHNFVTPDAFLEKPPEASEFLNAIQDILSKGASHNE